MRGVVSNLSENEWVDLGRAAKSIRDRIMDYCVISCNRFGKSSSMYKSFKTLDSDFLKVRSRLDDFVSGAYSMDVHEIAGCSITGVFFGDSLRLGVVVTHTFKRGQLPHSFEPAQEQDLVELFGDIRVLLNSISSHEYLVKRFTEKEAKARLTRFKKNVKKLQQLVQ